MELSSFSPVDNKGESSYLTRVVYKDAEFDNSAKVEGQRYENVEIDIDKTPGSKKLQWRESLNFPKESPLTDTVPHNAIEVRSTSGEHLYVDMSSGSRILTVFNNDPELNDNPKSTADIGRCCSIVANDNEIMEGAGAENIYMEIESDNRIRDISNGDIKQYSRDESNRAHQRNAELQIDSRTICIEAMPERSTNNTDRQLEQIAPMNNIHTEDPDITREKQTATRVVSLRLVVVMCLLSIFVLVIVYVAAEVVVHHVLTDHQKSNETDDRIKLKEEIQKHELEIIKKELEHLEQEILKIKEDIDDCISNPCVHGTCLDKVNSYKCLCSPGYSGINCAVDIDDCISNPCVHGTCLDQVNSYKCLCSPGYSWINCTVVVPPTDCYDVLQFGVGNTSGVYAVRMPKSHTLVNVYCDMTTEGGGWTVFQYRFDGSVEFYETFARYETGFGDVHGEFWLGLKFINEMTYQTKSEIYMNFMDSNGNIAMERFSDFYISAGSDYTLHVGELLQLNDTTSSNSLKYNNGSRFSAIDVDHDTYRIHCAQVKHGGWWHKDCTYINPNGDYATPGQQSSYDGGLGGMVNRGWRSTESLKSTKLMFRRI